MDFKNKKVLIVYFSKKGENWWTSALSSLKVGNTDVFAHLIQKHAGGDLFEVVRVKEYPNGYYECCDEAKLELKAKARPAIKEHHSAEGYDIIFIGYPTWWGTLPMPLFSWIEENNLQGKTIIPFNTSEGSGFGKGVADLKKELPESTFLNGLALRGHAVADSEKEIVTWLESL
jgi:flavodoxin